jgi:hypothetical protein
LLCNSSVSTIPRQRRHELFKRVLTVQLAARLCKGGYRQFKFSTRGDPVRDSSVHDKESRVQKTEIEDAVSSLCGVKL